MDELYGLLVRSFHGAGVRYFCCADSLNEAQPEARPLPSPLGKSFWGRPAIVPDFMPAGSVPCPSSQ